jgi:Fibronectin type III domain
MSCSSSAEQSIIEYRAFSKPLTDHGDYPYESCVCSREPSFKITNLTSAAHSKQIDAISDGGEIFKTLAPVPPFVAATVTLLSCEIVNSQQVVVRFAPVAGAAGYVLQYKKTADPDDSYSQKNVIGSPVQLENLIPATTYSVRMQAIDGPFGPVITCVTLLPSPTSISVGNVSDTSASVSWSSVNGAATYMLQYRTASDVTWIDVATVADVALTHIMTSLQPRTTYVVRAHATGGMVGPESTFTTLLPPPASVTAINLSDVSATITWSPVVGAPFHVLRYKKATDATYRMRECEFTT